MIKVFFPLLLHIGVADMDCFFQIGLQLFLGRGCVPSLKGFAKTIQRRAVLPCLFPEPRLDLIAENRMDFPVGNRQPPASAFRDSPLRQIAGRKKDAPQMVNGIIHLLIRQLLADCLFHRLSRHQLFDLPLRRAPGHFDKMADHIVAAGV